MQQQQQQEFNSNNLKAMSTSQYDFEMNEPQEDFDSFNENKTILDNNLSKSKRQAVSYRRVADRRRQPSKKFRHSNMDPNEYSNNTFIDEFLGGTLSVPDRSSFSNFKSESLTSFNTTTNRHFDDEFEPLNNNNNNVVDSLPPQPTKPVVRSGLSRKDKDQSRYNTVCIVDSLLNEKLNEFKLKEEKKVNLVNSFTKADQQKRDFNNNSIANNAQQLRLSSLLNKSASDYSNFVYKPPDKSLNETIEQQRVDDLKQSVSDSSKSPKPSFTVSIDQIHNEMGKLKLVTKAAPKIIHFNSNDGSTPTTPVPPSTTTVVAHTPTTRTFNFTIADKQVKKDDSKPLSPVNSVRDTTPINSTQQKNAFENVKLRSSVVHKQTIAHISSSKNGENTENLIPKRPKTMSPDNLDSLKTNNDNLKTVISISYNDNRKSEIPTTTTTTTTTRNSTTKPPVLVDSNPNTKQKSFNTSLNKSYSVKPRAQSPNDGNSDIPKWKLDLMNKRKKTNVMTTSALENAELARTGSEKSTSVTFQPVSNTPVIQSPPPAPSSTTGGGQIISNKSTNVTTVMTPTSVSTGVNSTNKTYINAVTYNFAPKITQVTPNTPSDITKLTQQNKQPKIFDLSIEHQPPLQQKQSQQQQQQQQTTKTNTTSTAIKPNQQQTTTITVAPPTSNITKPAAKVPPSSNAYESSIPEWKRALIEKKKQQKTVA